MQYKNTITIVHVMAGMRGLKNYMAVIWNTDVGRTLKYCKRFFKCKHGHREIAPLKEKMDG